MNASTPALSAALLLALALPACESTQEPAMTLADAPPAVAYAIDAAYPDAEVLEVEREDDGSTWEVEVQPVGGAPARELTIDAEGTILEDEEE